MPIAHVTEFEVEPGDRSVAHHDAVMARACVEEHPPDGLIVHAAGFSGDGTFRIFDVWESAEHAQRFHDERLAPVLAALEANLVAPARQRSHSYELHHVAR